VNHYELDRPLTLDRADERAVFIRRVYAHLAGAILAFVGLEALLFKYVDPATIFGRLGGGPMAMLVIMGVFIGGSMLAQMWARSETSQAMQYVGLGLYVVLETVIFFPLLYYVSNILHKPEMIGQAGILTLMVVAGLTLSVFMTKKDYSFLAPVLTVGSMVAFGVIIAGVLFGFHLGLFFSFAMVALMSGYILWETSMIVRTYPTHMYVSAALMLFASIATLFWYILRIVMELSNNRN